MATSQTQKILNFLLGGGKITAIEALKKFGCFRLAARIANIRDMNKYKVVTEFVVTKSKKRIARYSIPV